jgi:hypothetical protein
MQTADPEICDLRKLDDISEGIGRSDVVLGKKSITASGFEKKSSHLHHPHVASNGRGEINCTVFFSPVPDWIHATLLHA